MAQIQRGLIAITAVFLAVGMLASMGAGAGAAEPTADDLKDAIEDVESYEYETEMSSSSTTVVDGEEQETHSEGTGEGAVSVTSGEMQETTSTETTGDETLEEGLIETEMYLVDDTYYMGTTAPGEETEWIQMDAPENEVVTEGLLAEYNYLLNASDVEVVGAEVIDGTETYVLEFDVDTTAYMEEMIAELENEDLNGANDSPNATNGDSNTDAAVDDEITEDIAEPDQDMTVTMWVNCETNLPVKSELTSHTYMDDLGAYEENNASEDVSEIESIETTITQTTYFEAYNEPIDIELPEEAEDAPTLEEQLEDFEAEFGENEEFDIDEDAFDEEGEFDIDEDELADRNAEEPDEDRTNDDC